MPTEWIYALAVALGTAAAVFLRKALQQKRNSNGSGRSGASIQDRIESLELGMERENRKRREMALAVEGLRGDVKATKRMLEDLTRGN